MKYSLQLVYILAVSAVIVFGYQSSQSTLDDVGITFENKLGEYGNKSSAAFVEGSPQVSYNNAAKERIVRYDNLIKSRSDVQRALANGEPVYYHYNFVELDKDDDKEVMFAISFERKKILLIYEATLDKKLGEFPILNGVIIENSSDLKWRRILVYNKLGKYTVYNFDGQVYKASQVSDENVMNFYEIKGLAYFTNLNSINALIIK